MNFYDVSKRFLEWQAANVGPAGAVILHVPVRRLVVYVDIRVMRILTMMSMALAGVS